MVIVVKRVVSTLIHTLELAICAIAIVLSSNVVIPIVAFLAALIPASKLKDDLVGNQVKNSIFSVSSNGKIEQNSLAKPLRMIKLFGKEDKLEEFRKEALNMFLELNKTNKKGEVIEYKTKSHILTYRLLNDLKKAGFIENLKKEDAGQSRLIMESIGLGNFKKIFSGKKTKMFNITFNLTDKERNIENLLELMNGKKKAVTDIKSVGDREQEISNSVSQESSLEEIKLEKAKLMAMKDELIEQKEALEQQLEQIGNNVEGIEEPIELENGEEENKMHM